MAKMKTTGQTTNEPWAGLEPYLKQGLGQAGSLLTSKSGFTPYQGSTTAPLGALTNSAIGQAKTGTSVEGDLRGVFSGLNDSASGKYLNGGNPYFAQQLNEQSGALTDDINRGFSLGGRYGSTSHVGELGEQVGSFRNSALSNNYNTERQLQQNAQGMQSGILGQIQQGRQSDLASKFTAGALQDAYSTAMMKDKQRIFEGNQQAPWNRLGAFANVITGQGGQYGTQTTKEPATPGKDILGALIGIGSMFL